MADRDLLERMDRSLERIDGSMERIDHTLERIDHTLERIDRHIEISNDHMRRGNELMERVTQEFELNREVQNRLLAEGRESHREVMARLVDLGVHMREQTQALIRIQGGLGPNAAT